VTVTGTTYEFIGGPADGMTRFFKFCEEPEVVAVLDHVYSVGAEEYHWRPDLTLRDVRDRMEGA